MPLSVSAPASLRFQRLRLRPGELALVCAAAVLVLGSCNPDVPLDGATDKKADPPAPNSSGETARLSLSLRDHGKTLSVDRGTKATLVLAGGYRWSTPISIGVEVHVDGVVSDAPEAGQIWELRADSVGEAVIRSTGTPNCRPNTQGCPSGNRDYVVTLVVS